RLSIGKSSPTQSRSRSRNTTPAPVARNAGPAATPAPPCLRAIFCATSISRRRANTSSRSSSATVSTNSVAGCDLLGRKFARDLCVNRRDLTKIDRHIDAALRQSRNHFFGRNISNERVLREGTTAQPADRGIESATTRIVSREHFCRRFSRRAVHVNADVEFISNRVHDFADQFCRSDPDSVRQRN